jgi:hypothetical protein
MAMIIGISIPTLRSSRVYPVRVEAPASRLIVPAGSHLTLKIAESVLRDGEAGETFEALTTQPILAGKQLAIPASTRAALHIDRLQKRREATVDLTVRVTELIFSNRNIAIHTAPVVAAVLPMSAFNLMMRSVVGMLGAAVGAADHAVIERDPIGAGALEGLAAGSGSTSDASATLHFQIDESIDVTGIRW